MTKVTMNPGDDGAALFYKAEEHAGDHDVCTMVSTLTNLMILRCQDRYQVLEYKPGCVQIMADRCDQGTNTVARAVLETLQEIEKQYPDHLKVQII